MEKFIVIVSATVAVPAVGDYRIVPESTRLDQTAKQVFGPDTKENCQKWIDDKKPVRPAAPPTPAAPENPAPGGSRRWTSYVTTGWTSYALVAAGLFALMFITVGIGGCTIESKATDLTLKLELKSPPADCAKITDPAQKAFIDVQRAEIVKYAESHRITAIAFYKYFYNTYMVFSLFGLFAAISLAVIVRTGIDEASPHLIAVFLVSTGIVLAYQGFFGVFQQKTNIDNNAKLFVSYAQLNTRIDTYCATGSLPIVDPKILLAQSLLQPPTEPPANPSDTTSRSHATSASNSNRSNSAATNSASTANSNVQSNAQTTTTTTAAANPSAAKIPTFSVALLPNDFINYVGWQMEQLKAISIAIDDKQVVAIDGTKLTLAKP